MRFADLMRLFREGQNEGRKRGYVSQGACDAEGIAAVVRALRDEILDIEPEIECCGKGVPNHDNTAEECCCSPDCWLHVAKVSDFFNEILGAAGDEAAGGPTREDGCGLQGQVTPAPAAAPAPVCEWVPLSGGRHLVPCRDYVGPVAAKWLKKGECPRCKAPIKFTKESK